MAIKTHCQSYVHAGDLKRILARQSEILFKKEMEFRTGRALIEAILSTINSNRDIHLESIIFDKGDNIAPGRDKKSGFPFSFIKTITLRSCNG